MVQQFARGCAARALALVVFAGAAADAWSQSPADYPVKPVRTVVVYGPGGGLDIVTRAQGGLNSTGMCAQEDLP